MNDGRSAAVQVVHATSHVQRDAYTPLVIQLQRTLLPCPEAITRHDE